MARPIVGWPYEVVYTTGRCASLPLHRRLPSAQAQGVQREIRRDHPHTALINPADLRSTQGNRLFNRPALRRVAMQVERWPAVAHVDHEIGASVKVLVQAVQAIRSTKGSGQDFEAFDLTIEHRPDRAGFPETN